MARPKQGYRNAAGMVIPGTTDVTGRFMDRSRLLYWAFNRGKQGHPQLYDDGALNIGTAVHMMCELDLKGRSRDDIEYYLETTLTDRADRSKAEAAYRAFRAWRDEFHVVTIEQEVSLVSEKLQFGGTLDTVALVRNEWAILDFKTSASGEVYEDMVLQLAAYGILWQEAHPDERAPKYHLIVLPKDGSAPVHREYNDGTINPYRQKFWLYRKAYDLDRVCNDPKSLKGEVVIPSEKPAHKPRVRVRVNEPAPTGAALLAALRASAGASNGRAA